MFKNMSTRAAETLREDLEVARPGACCPRSRPSRRNAQDRAPPGRRRPDRAGSGGADEFLALRPRPTCAAPPAAAATAWPLLPFHPARAASFAAWTPGSPAGGRARQRQSRGQLQPARTRSAEECQADPALRAARQARYHAGLPRRPARWSRFKPELRAEPHRRRWARLMQVLRGADGRGAHDQIGRRPSRRHRRVAGAPGGARSELPSAPQQPSVVARGHQALLMSARHLALNPPAPDDQPLVASKRRRDPCARRRKIDGITAAAAAVVESDLGIIDAPHRVALAPRWARPRTLGRETAWERRAADADAAGRRRRWHPRQTGALPRRLEEFRRRAGAAGDAVGRWCAWPAWCSGGRRHPPAGGLGLPVRTRRPPVTAEVVGFNGDRACT